MTDDHQVGRTARVLWRIDEHHGADGDDKKARDNQQRYYGPEDFEAAGSEALPRFLRVSTPSIPQATVDHSACDYEKDRSGDYQDE